MTLVPPGALYVELRKAEATIDGLRQELVRRDEQVQRLTRALADIADADYRGNRAAESYMAHEALVREGLRPEAEVAEWTKEDDFDWPCA